MNQETTASKIHRLLQKSRQAFRIYSSMSKSAKAEQNAFADMQAIEWKNINAELIRQLSHIVERYSGRHLSIQIARMRDQLLSDFRRVEAELNTEHREIISSAERGDFIRVAQLARGLISKKAFVQAAQAAGHELSLIIEDKQSAQHRDSDAVRGESFAPESPADLSNNAVVSQVALIQAAEFTAPYLAEEEILPRRAKVIPLRR